MHGQCVAFRPSSFVLVPRAGTEMWNEQFSLSLGHCSSRRPVGLCCHRWHVFAAGSAAADHTGHRLVGRRRIQRHDDRLSCNGLRQHDLGDLVGSGRAASGSADRLDRHRGKPCAGEPCDVVDRVSAPLRPADGSGDCRYLRADDGLRHRLVRHPSQPCGVAGVGRHGDGTDDHVAAGGLARLQP